MFIVISDQELCRKLPFATLNNDELRNNFVPSNNGDSHNKCFNLVFDPLLAGNEIYNKNVDEYDFFCNIVIPKTEYVYLSNIELASSNILTILNLNIRSIPKNLQLFVDSVLHNSSIKLNIIGFTEIRLNPSLYSLYKLPGYHMFVNERNVYGGGVAIYVDSVLEATLVEEFTISHDYIETVCIEVNNMSRRCLNICVYRPPSGNFTHFYDAMSNILSSAYAKKIMT